MILGYAGAGKDTVAKHLGQCHDFTFTSSSEFAANRIMMHECTKLGIFYKSVQHCFEDRVHHRKFWYDCISDYNKDDPARLVREIYKESDIYVGLRNTRELDAAKKQRLIDVCIWVDNPRIPPESTDSCTVGPRDADFVLKNHGTLKQLYQNIDRLMQDINNMF